jgi:hypothetical protein
LKDWGSFEDDWRFDGPASETSCSQKPRAFLKRTPLSTTTVKISWLSQKRLEICAIYFRVEEMMRNASCYVVYFLYKINYIFPKRQVSQTPSMYIRVSIFWASKWRTLHTNAHKTVYLMISKSDPKVVWNMTIIASGLSLRPIRVTTFTILGPHKNHSTSSGHSTFLFFLP